MNMSFNSITFRFHPMLLFESRIILLLPPEVFIHGKQSKEHVLQAYFAVSYGSVTDFLGPECSSHCLYMAGIKKIMKAHASDSRSSQLAPCYQSSSCHGKC